MSSLMDIIFILLIFVMVSLSFSKQIQKIPIELPKTTRVNTGVGEEASVQISLKKDGSIELAGKILSVEELLQRITK
ncbi:MAG: biopolymer transporter ExbD, partial [Spirochaetota bacterium]